jgi:hypothetical protein
MSSLKSLKKELKEVKKELKLKKNIKDNMELKALLQQEISLKEDIKAKGHKTTIIDKMNKKLNDYDPQIKLLDKIKYVGHNIMGIRFNASKYNGGDYSKNKVLNISKQTSVYLKKKGIEGKIMTSIKHPDYGWRSGYFSSIGEKVKLFDPTNYYNVEPDALDIKYSNFVIYVVVKPKPKGGSDLYNDCLYNCLKYMIFDFDKFFESPEKLKKYLGLKRNDKIPIKNIEKIEKKLSTYQINVRGDYIYTSTLRTNKSINLLLQNEHYTVDDTVKKPLLNKTARFYEKKVVLYDKLTYELYDGFTKKKISIEERYDILYNFKSPYILFDREEQKKGVQTQIEDEYKQLIIDIDLLKKESNNVINLYKTGNVNNTCLDLFDKMTRFLAEPENILQDEGIWIKEATTGSLIWGEKFEGNVYKYDVKSHYPYIMMSKNKFPLKRGEFIKLDTIDNIEHFQFGIYRVIIEPSENEHINKLFRFSFNNYYTHISLEHARKLGLIMTLIIDDEPNFLFYSRDKLITFEEVFKPYVMFLFDLKNKNVNKAKDIMNRLWGKLGEYDRSKKYDDKDININEDEEIIELRPCNKNENINLIKTNKINKPYKYNYARLIPFIKSIDRKYICEIIYDHKENIHQILTDGFLSDKLIHSNEDVKIGELKYEGLYENVIIKNCAKVI